MQLRTELNHNTKTSHKQNLPRGYFKKRKHEHDRPSQKAKMMQTNCLKFVNKKLLIFLIISMGLTISEVSSETSTIEPDLKRVVALNRTETPTSDNKTGICGTIDIRFNFDLSKLRDCRVVEGSVSMLLLDDLTEEAFRNISYPDLLEITGFLMLYRISGIKKLHDLFPNLAVIRGRDIFKDYSLIIYELEDLEEIGMINLQSIERGNVRIEKNNKLCYADKIDWTLIAGSGEHYVAKNQLPAHCPHCNKTLDCLKTRNDQRCWNQEHCQVKCNCTSRACTKSGKCCDSNCIGGCEEDDPRKCKACKKFMVGDYDNFYCSDSCPDGYYEYLQRRCLTKQECYKLIAPSSPEDQKKLSFIPYKHTCMIGCPTGFIEFMDTDGLTCRTCEPDCLKRCQAKIIDSIAAAQSLKGCAIIEGPLEIQIRSSSKTTASTTNVVSSNNVVKELENSLSDIVEINDYLKIARSFPIVSLSFLKKLRVIRGNRLESNKYSLIIWDNQNLEELWSENQKVQIDKGKLFFYFNPKLCFYKVEKLAKTHAQIENYETASKSNGDKISCNVTTLNVKVAKVLDQAAILSWSPLQLGDERSLLSYVVFYLPAPYQNVTLWEGRDACGNDGWLVDDVNDFTSTEEVTYPMTKLEPFTQYAFYVKAYMLSTEKTGAQSNIDYFRTLPGQPQAVSKLKAIEKSSSSVEISWEPPKKINGEFSHYVLRAKMVDRNELVLDQRNYCLQPFEPSDAVIKTDVKVAVQEKVSFDPVDRTCDCQSCSATCSAKEAKEGDEQRQSAIDFEDEIQDYVYVKSEPNDNHVRAKRQTPEKFPEDDDQETTKKKEPETVSRQNLDKEFEYFYLEITNVSQNSYELQNLKHYSNYQIFLRACREKTIPDTMEDHCGPEAQITALTMKKEENDIITNFDAFMVQSNGSSLGSIRVSWKPPLNPNGLILTYLIRYKKFDPDHERSWESVCLPLKDLGNNTVHVIQSLTSGNYSVQIAATSMAGKGDFKLTRYAWIDEPDGKTTSIIVLTIILVVVVAILLLIVYYFMRRHYPPISNMKLIANVNPDYAGVQYKQDGWEVLREKIILLQELGQGSFGMVYEGIIRDIKIEGSETQCAVKTVNDNATDKERISFLNEASVMKQFDCAFVVKLLGVVSTSQPTFVVMELMANGDLKGYLRSHRPEYDSLYEHTINPLTQPPTLRQILQMAAEIADGMSYLSAKKFVHRDLAARNCMVASDLTVKIGDFGMTRDIYETDYYRKGTKGLLPVRWMSPESLKDGVFTSSSDVFSYGVVLWEMATLASQPYQGLSNDQVLRYVIDGGVMERPENCPDKLYELMRKCWQHRPSARPTFMDIIENLLDDVNQNFRNIAFYFTKEGQDALNQQRQGDFAVNITDDVTTPLRADEEETSSNGNHFLMDDMNMNSDHKLH